MEQYAGKGGVLAPRASTSAAIVAVAMVLGLAPAGVDAQGQAQGPGKAVEKKKAAPAKAGTKAAQPKPAPAPQPEPRPQVPDATRLTLLIQSYLVALSQANLTGNYGVLHAFGAPAFQQENPPDKLAQVFAALRSGNIDLTPILLYTPILDKPAAFDEQGLLHLVGHYDTKPQQVNFDLTLQPVGGMWRLFGISVQTVPAETAPGETAPAETGPAATAPAATAPAPPQAEANPEAIAPAEQPPPAPARKPPKPKEPAAASAAPPAPRAPAASDPIKPAIGGN